MKTLLHLGLALVLLGTASCGEEPVEAESQGAAVVSLKAMLGKTDSQDQADRGCQVVLRSMARAAVDGEYTTDCSSGSCLFVWQGLIDVAEAVPADLTVHLQYHLANSNQWWETEALLDSASTLGYRSYRFSISDHLFGPDVSEGEAPSVEVVAFLRDADGARTFDHNRFSGDFENNQLTADNGFTTDDGGVCRPVLGWVEFLSQWIETTAGERRQGGYLQISYDLSRLPDCRGTHNGYPAWDIVAHAKFTPGGEQFEGSVRSFMTNNGQPTNEAVSVPFVVRIPDGATGVELWFHNYTGAGSSCQSWDSNMGENYYFDVWPDANDPKCLNVEKETGANTEDPRMVHMSSYCFNYDPAVQADATNCEFYVDGFGNGHMGHYGIPIDWVVAYLKTASVEGEVLNAGMYTMYHDNSTGQAGERFSLGIEVSTGVWKTGFNYHVTGFQSMQPVDVTVDAYAFFLDVKRPAGDVIRLWQSGGGANYTWGDAFDLPTTKEYIPYGNIEWANDSAPVRESRSACVK